MKNIKYIINDLKSNAMPGVKAQIIFWFLALGGLALDLWSKKAVFNWLAGKENYEHSIIEGFLRFVRVLNDGAAGGILSGHKNLLAGIIITAAIGIIVIFFFSRRQPLIFHIALGFLWGGVCGNMYDRLFNDGRVRDFIDVNTHINNYHWPAFNVADSLLCIGAGLLVIFTVFTGRPAQKHDQQQK